MVVDYARYGEGEALLGWLNGTVRFECGEEVDGNSVLEALAATLGSTLAERELEVAHLKMTLNPIGDHFEIGAINLVRDGDSAEFSHRLSEPLEDGDEIGFLDPDEITQDTRWRCSIHLRQNIPLLRIEGHRTQIHVLTQSGSNAEESLGVPIHDDRH